MQQPQLKVERTQAENFGKVWTHRGVSIPLSDVSLQFATDFANVVLLSFLSTCQQNMKAKDAAKEVPALVSQ